MKKTLFLFCVFIFVVSSLSTNLTINFSLSNTKKSAINQAFDALTSPVILTSNILKSNLKSIANKVFINDKLNIQSSSNANNTDNSNNTKFVFNNFVDSINAIQVITNFNFVTFCMLLLFSILMVYNFFKIKLRRSRNIFFSIIFKIILNVLPRAISDDVLFINNICIKTCA